jgi:hypothetical protein
MPRFYFDISDGNDLQVDSEGEVLSGVDAAEHEAAVCAAFHSRDELPARRTREVTVLVRDQNNQPLLTATVTLSIKRAREFIE